MEPTQYHVYVVKNKLTDHEYVGSTTNFLRVRLNQHKNFNSLKKLSPLQQLMTDLGKSNFYIELLQSFPMKCKNERMKNEGKYIIASRDRIGDMCLNIRNACGLTSTERYRLKRDENIDEYRKQQRQYRLEHPKKCRQYERKYYANNRDMLREKQKQNKVSCLYCRSTYFKSHFQRHCRTQLHETNKQDYFSRMQ